IQDLIALLVFVVIVFKSPDWLLKLVILIAFASKKIFQFGFEMPQRQLGEYPTLMIRQRRIHTPIFPHSVASESRPDTQNNNSELPPSRENHRGNEENADHNENRNTTSNRSWTRRIRDSLTRLSICRRRSDIRNH
ncbi:unnamed protein product, partial [Hymenolepis diminuta]